MVLYETNISISKADVKWTSSYLIMEMKLAISFIGISCLKNFRIFVNLKLYVPHLKRLIAVRFLYDISNFFDIFLQGGEGECFYVVGSGEFEVLATQVTYPYLTCL